MPHRASKWIHVHLNYQRFTTVFMIMIALVLAGNWFNDWQDKRVEKFEQDRQEVVDSTPITEWFEITKLIVPDFYVGDNPVIQYERVIKKVVKGNWKSRVLLYNADTDRYTYICGNSGFNEVTYEPQAELPNPVRWNWLVFGMGSCVSNMVPGTYRLYLDFVFCPEIMSICKPYRYASNLFTVSIRG